MSTVIAYVPALHRGYIDLFKRYSAIRVLDLALVREMPRMERDIRALNAEEMVLALKGIGFSDVRVLGRDDMDGIGDLGEIAMPDEDVSRRFAEEFLIGRDISFIPVFLRWDRHSAERKSAVMPDETVSGEEFDKMMMGKAFTEAERSPDWWRQIGAVASRDGKVLLTGFNRPLPSDQTHNIFGDPRSNFDYGVGFEISKFIHAEAGVIAEAAKRGISLKGASLYVTTFPCPVCAKLAAVAGISKVYYSEGYSLLDARDILDSFDIEVVRVES